MEWNCSGKAFSVRQVGGAESKAVLPRPALAAAAILSLSSNSPVTEVRETTAIGFHNADVGDFNYAGGGASARICFSRRSTPAPRRRPAITLSDRREASYSTRTVRSFSLNAIRRTP